MSRALKARREGQERTFQRGWMGTMGTIPGRHVGVCGQGSDGLGCLGLGEWNVMVPSEEGTAEGKRGGILAARK